MTRFKWRIGPLSGLVCLWMAAVLIQNSGYLMLLLGLAAFFVHEMGHISFGGLMGYRTLELRLTPLGGCLAMDPVLLTHPEAELMIAAAGPLMNLLMAGGVYYLGLLGVSHCYLDLWQKLNLMIGGFNLLPTLPLDGGRICHAFLSSRLGERTASFVGKRITAIIAVLSLVLGINKMMSRQGGLFFIILAGLSLAQIWRFHSPGLDLTWRLRQRKRKQLQNQGYLQLKPVLVEEASPIRRTLQQCGSGEGLLFLVTDRDHRLTAVSEEQAWETMIQNGIQATFRETLS